MGSSAGFDNMLDLLDQIEEQIERVKTDALRIMEEKNDIEKTLDLIRGYQLNHLNQVERNDIEDRIERLHQRLQSVHVDVKTPRSQAQKESLHSVNTSIDTLIMHIQTDASQANLLCRQYLSAAGAEDSNSQAPCVRFEKHLLGCALEDQKEVKKRLTGLQEHIKVIISKGIQEAED